MKLSDLHFTSCGNRLQYREILVFILSILTFSFAHQPTQQPTYINIPIKKRKGNVEILETKTNVIEQFSLK